MKKQCVATACILLIVLGLTSCQGALNLNIDVLAAQAARYNVRILRDTWGVPHIFGETDADTAYGLAYAHCEDDFATIQEGLLAVRGGIASVKGKDAAPIDYMTALFRVRETVDEKYKRDLSPETRAMCRAYAVGVNLYAALHPGAVLRSDLFPVSGKDVVAGFVQKVPFFYGLQHAIQELFKDKRQHPVSEKKQAAVGSENKGWDYFFSHDNEIGSNAFAVASSRSADGKTRIAINSHQPWTGPVAWYEAHVHSNQGLDLVGGVFPGSPVILHGHNRHLGWAHTVNHPDLADIYVLEMNPDNANQYKFDGQWRDLEVSNAYITVKLWGPIHWTVKREVLRSVYGPTIRQPHGVYSIRYAGMDDVRQVEQWYRMGKARNFDEWLDAVKMRALPSLNIVYADAPGNIYYLYNALIPKRAPGYQWQEYLPGNTSETLWTEYEPFEKLPQVKNPPSGFVFNCNSSPYQATVGEGNPKPEDFPASWGVETTMTNRAYRAQEILGADGPITEERFLACKYDIEYSKKSQAAELMRQIFAAPASDDPLVEEAKQAMRDWDLRVNVGNPCAAISILTLEPVVRATMFGNTPPDLMATLKEKAHLLKDTFGKIRVPWEQVNHLRRGKLVLGLSGGPDVLHAVYGKWNNGELEGEAGDSYILIAEGQDRQGLLAEHPPVRQRDHERRLAALRRPGPAVRPMQAQRRLAQQARHPRASGTRIPACREIPAEVKFGVRSRAAEEIVVGPISQSDRAVTVRLGNRTNSAPNCFKGALSQSGVAAAALQVTPPRSIIVTSDNFQQGESEWFPA